VNYIYGLFEKFSCIYGPSINCPSLRFAILAFYLCLNPRYCASISGEYYIRKSMCYIPKERDMDYSEGDLFAISFLTFAVWEHKLHSFIRTGLRPSEMLPTMDIQVRWFVAIAKALETKYGKIPKSYPLREFWPSASWMITSLLPRCLNAREISWESFNLIQQVIPCLGQDSSLLFPESLKPVALGSCAFYCYDVFTSERTISTCAAIVSHAIIEIMRFQNEPSSKMAMEKMLLPLLESARRTIRLVNTFLWERFYQE
jgi:hypothetical protein